MFMHFYKFQESSLSTRIWGEGEKVCVHAVALFVVFKYNSSLRRPDSCPLQSVLTWPLKPHTPLRLISSMK